MIKYNQVFCVFVLSLLSNITFAQNGESPSINSPYTRYGYGQLSDQSFGNSKAMGGIGYGLRDRSHINPTNPASYTAIDSLTFLMEGGISIQNANLNDGTIKRNAKNSTFDYIAMQFRLHPRIGLSLGFLPFSNVGYNLGTSNYVPNEDGTDNEVITTNSFVGTGGLNQVYVGAGFKILNGLSIGANISYLYGTISHTSTRSYNDYNVDITRKINQVKVNDYKLDFGVQYTQKINNKNLLTLGAVYSLKHSMNNDAYYIEEMRYYQSSSSSTTYLRSQNIDTISNGFSMPHMFGVGLTYRYDDKLMVGVDYTLQKWGEVPFFKDYNQLRDRNKIALGIEYLPNRMSRNYFSKIKYRAGAYYSDPYVKIDSKDGAQEFGVSAGFGLPVYRSVINISGQYIRVKPKSAGLIEENYLRLNIGLTFNERWFAKWKVQ